MMGGSPLTSNAAMRAEAMAAFEASMPVELRGDDVQRRAHRVRGRDWLARYRGER